MALKLKKTHNLVAYLTPDPVYKIYHQVIQLMIDSQYYTALTINPSIHEETLQEFWRNATVMEIDGSAAAIKSKIRGKAVTITPASLSTSLNLQDALTPTSFTKGAMHATFVECEYQGNLSSSTLYKRFLEPRYKFVFHTVLQSLGPKSTGWDQMPFALSQIFYSILSGTRFRASQYFFGELVKNLYDKEGKYLMYPRFVMQCLIDAIQNDALIGPATEIKGLQKQIFTRMDTPAQFTEDDQGEQTIPEEPTSSQPQRKKSKAKKPSSPKTKKTKPKRVVQEARGPESTQATQRPEQPAAETSSQLGEPSSPQPQAPPSSSQKEMVVQTSDNQTADASFEHQTEPLQSGGDLFSSFASPHSFQTLLDAALQGEGTQLSPPGSPIPPHIMGTTTEKALDSIATPNQGDEDVVTPPIPEKGSEPIVEADPTHQSTEDDEDRVFIAKTSTMATADEGSRPEAGSPQYQEQGAHGIRLVPSHVQPGLTRGMEVSFDVSSKGYILDLQTQLQDLEAEVLRLQELITKMLKEKVHHTQTNPMMASSLQPEDHPNTTTTEKQPPASSTSGQTDFSPLFDPSGPLATMITNIVATQFNSFTSTYNSLLNSKLDMIRLSNETRYNQLSNLIKDLRAQLAHLSGVAPPAPWFPPTEEAKKGEKEQHSSLLQQARAAKVAQDHREEERRRAEQKEIKRLNQQAKTKAPLQEKNLEAQIESSQTKEDPLSSSPQQVFPIVHTYQRRRTPAAESVNDDDDNEDQLPLSQVIKMKKRKLILEEEEEDQVLPAATSSVPETDPQAQEVSLFKNIQQRKDLNEDQKLQLYQEQLDKMKIQEDKEYREKRNKLIEFILSNSRRQESTISSWSLEQLENEITIIKDREKKKKKMDDSKIEKTYISQQAVIPFKKPKAVDPTFQATARGDLVISATPLDFTSIMNTSSSQAVEEYKKRMTEKDLIVFKDVMMEEKPILTASLNPDHYAYQMVGSSVDAAGRKVKKTEVYLPGVGTKSKTTTGSVPPPASVVLKEALELKGKGLPGLKNDILLQLHQHFKKRPYGLQIIRWTYNPDSKTMTLTRGNHKEFTFKAKRQLMRLPNQDLFEMIILPLEETRLGASIEGQEMGMNMRAFLSNELLARINSSLQ